MRSIVCVVFLAFALSSAANATIVLTEVGYKDGDTVLKGYLAYDDARKGRRPALLVVHEWWGISKHVRDRAKELAASGYTALAVDMYGDGKVGEDPKTAGELAGAVRKAPAVMRSRFNAGRAFLASHATVDPKRIGAIGYSFGGTVVLEMARRGGDLVGVASFYGNLVPSTPASPGNVRAKVLVLNGADDPLVKPESIDAFKKEMDAAKADYRFINYPGVVHSFSNPESTEKGKRFNMPLAYNAEVDRQSDAEMLKFFAGLFGKP